MFVLPLLCSLFIDINKQRSTIDIIEPISVIILMIVGNVIRQHASLPIFAILMFYFCVRIFVLPQEKRVIICLTEMVAVGILFFSSEPVLHKAYDVCSGKLNIENVEKPWHAIWCGLGYNENEYGFEWLDSAAADYVKSVDAEAAYCSEEYFEILKERVIDVAKSYPGFIIKTCWNKFIESIRLGMERFGRKLLLTVGI